MVTGVECYVCERVQVVADRCWLEKPQTASAGVDWWSHEKAPVVVTGVECCPFEGAQAAVGRYLLEKAPTAAAGADRRG